VSKSARSHSTLNASTYGMQLPVVYGFHGLIVASYVGMQGILQAADELVVLNILLLNQRLDTFVKVSLVPMVAAVISVHVFREMADRSVSLFKKRVVVVTWTGRCTRIRRVDRDSSLSRNGLRGDHGVRRAVTEFFRR